jgi:hypothetical protein
MVNNEWHFPVMIVASVVIFYLIIRVVLSKEVFQHKQKHIFLLALFVVVLGMVFGKYGATFGLPWWVYYPIPMLITVLLPPIILKLSAGSTTRYLIFSFLSAPFIHFIFSFLIGWTEYMPFWRIPFVGTLFA